MTEKIYPSEIARLLAKHDGVVAAAERAAGVSRGYFARIIEGRKAFTELTKNRVLKALGELPEKEGNAVTTKRRTEIPETCPPLLKELIEFKGGSKKATSKALGVSEPSLYLRVDGKSPMPPEWIIKAKVAMGQPVIGAPAQEAPAPVEEPQGPPFVPWDGKSVKTIKVKGMHGQPLKVLKGVPVPLALLIEKFDGSRSEAARATAHTPGWLGPLLDDPKKKFKDKAQRIVHAALHGLPLPTNGGGGDGGGPINQDYDKYELGIAIVFANGGALDRINEIAEILRGRLAYKRNTKSGWIFMYKMDIDDLPRFKKLVARDASDVVCP